MNNKRILVGALAVVLLLRCCPVSEANQPRLGIQGTLVQLPQSYGDLRGIRVGTVYKGSLAQAAGLERGDIIVYVGGSFAFTTYDSFQYALRQQGQSTRLGVINVRTGRLLWVNCRLNHNPAPHYDEPIPRGVVMVDFDRGRA